LREALFYAQRAAEEYEKLEAYDSLADIQYLISVLHHNLGQVELRDAAARRNIEYEQHSVKMSGVAVEEKTMEVWKVVADVGIALASRK
jgi:anaphase-promoting complex subunit 5